MDFLEFQDVFKDDFEFYISSDKSEGYMLNVKLNEGYLNISRYTGGGFEGEDIKELTLHSDVYLSAVNIYGYSRSVGELPLAMEIIIR